ncbi:hypothetical protein K5V21_01885 [Clostridium sardiniense]|uniref:DUF5673 domain-containing protein n=2 Tax=Clostridium sardiniense TaxID=29369 RepID=A0ABS7KTQ9_CLOSR|nr:hypothetical protein [Clostridium sardiniense]MBY0754196.1 hypothetical protein [Clostridium sardiniense]
MEFKMVINLIIIMLNLLVLYLLLRSKMKLTNRSFTVINLNNINKGNWNRWINFFVIPLAIISFIILVYNLFSKNNDYYNIWFIYYVPLIFFVNPVIYINDKYIGTIYKIIDTQNLKYIEVSIKYNNVKVLFYYVDKTNNEITFNVSTYAAKRNYELSKKIIDALRKYNYEVYLNEIG